MPIFAFLIQSWELIAPAVSYATTVIFLGAAIILTLHSRFAQIRLFPRFLSLVKKNIWQYRKAGRTDAMSPLHALLTAMGTTIGMGNIVGPGVAILLGGPGALLWLLVYIFFASVTKFVEVTFAVATRTTSSDGKIIGGPMIYLHTISNWLSYWYSFLAIFLFTVWTSLQAHTLADIFALESIPKPVVSGLLALVVFTTLYGGARRVGEVASKLVPVMFILYMVFAIALLSYNITALVNALSLIFKSALHPQAAVGCFAGFSLMQAMRAGTYRAIFITEAGMGTASIAHAMADTKKPTDQGILAMFSMLSDALISVTSGLLVIVLGVCHGPLRNSMIYEAFTLGSPFAGRFIVLATITLFVTTTAIGNSFNGMQTFSSLTKHRFLWLYSAVTIAMIIIGPLLHAKLMWDITDIVLALVAIPNIIGILILAFTKPHVIKV